MYRLVALSSVLAIANFSAIAADVEVRTPAGGAFAVRNNSGATTVLQAQENGVVTIPSLTSAGQKNTTLCFDSATGQLGKCAPGAPSSGLAAYGSFSNDSGSAYNVTIGGVSIDFFDTSVANNVSLTSPIATLPQAGTYKFSYCIRATANSSASSRLVVNGAAINASIVTPVSQTDKWCRSTMLSLISTNSTVLVQLFGTLAPVTLISPGGAELLIEKLN